MHRIYLHSVHLPIIRYSQTSSEEPNRNCREPAPGTKPRAARGHTHFPSLMFDSPAPSTQASSLEALPLLRHSDICASCRACGICHEHRRRSARRARGCAGGERRRGESAGRTAVSRGAEAPYSASHERQEGIAVRRTGCRRSGRVSARTARESAGGGAGAVLVARRRDKKGAHHAPQKSQ